MRPGLVAITGNTYVVKERLKAMGAQWDPQAKKWMIEPVKLQAAQAIVSGRSGSQDQDPAPHRPGQATGQADLLPEQAAPPGGEDPDV